MADTYDIKKVIELMYHTFEQILAEDCDAEAGSQEPYAYPDEIAERLREAGAGARVSIYDLFPDATEHTYRGTEAGHLDDEDLILRIYDAIEDGYPVSINGQEFFPGRSFFREANE